jgi:hypothetical protein
MIILMVKVTMNVKSMTYPMEDKKYLVSLSNTLTHIFPALDTVLD